MNSKTSIYIKILLVALLWGTVGVFRRYIPVSSSMLALLRSVIGFSILTVVLFFQKKGAFQKVAKMDLFWFAVSGIIIGLNWILLFESYKYTTVAVATMCYYMQPTILILLSPIFFKEKLDAKRIFCMLISLAGMVLISGVLSDSSERPSTAGVLFGLGAAVLYTFGIIVIKKNPYPDSMRRTQFQFLFSTIVLLPYIIGTGDNSLTELTPVSIVLALILGIVHTGIAYTVFYGNIDKVPAQSVALISYADPVFALVLSVLFLHEKMGIEGAVGAALIFAAAIINEKK